MSSVWKAFGLTLAALAVSSAIVKAETTSPYKIEAVPLGDGERWDYVTFDPASGRAYIAHGDHVTVVDVAKSGVVGRIEALPGGSHGIGISNATGKGYTDDGKAGIVAVFDLATLKITNRIPAAPDADGIFIDPVTGHVFVINGDSGSITVIDPKTDAVVATLNIGAGLEAGVMDGSGKFYVDGAENHDIVEIDTRKNEVEAHWPMADCQKPHGIAIDPKNRRIFATCVNKVMDIVDADSGAHIGTLPIGASSDGAAFDPIRKRIFSSNGDGTLSVFEERDAQTFVPLPTVKTAPSARTIAIDSYSGRLYLPAADIARIDPPAKAGERAHTTYVPGSLRLLVLSPQP